MQVLARMVADKVIETQRQERGLTPGTRSRTKQESWWAAARLSIK
jgi:hypothetical protein